MIDLKYEINIAIIVSDQNYIHEGGLDKISDFSQPTRDKLQLSQCLSKFGT